MSGASSEEDPEPSDARLKRPALAGYQLAFNGLEPLAVLARPPHGTSREHLLDLVTQRICDQPDAERRIDQLGQMAVLAAVHHDRSTPDTILWRWTRMAVDVRELPLIQDLIEESRAEALEKGRADGATELLIRILDASVGPLDQRQRDAIAALDDANRGDLALAMRTFTGAGDLDAWLAAHR